MIGTYDDACLALARFREGDWTDLLSPNGTTRMVYLINGIVYKCEDSDDNGYNESEYTNIRRHANDLPKGFYFPDVSLFDVDGNSVIAMEYIDGIAMSECFCIARVEFCDNTCAPSFVVDLMYSLGFDSGGFNVIDCEGAYYIIDAA